MLDESTPTESGSDDLVLTAMLYASGELDADAAAAFEQRLGDDQAARDALCQAVELTQGLGSQPTAVPDPEYRSKVRHRLRQRRRRRVGLSNLNSPFFAHPAFWSVMGAALAVLLMVIISHMMATTDFGPPPTTPATNRQAPPE